MLHILLSVGENFIRFLEKNIENTLAYFKPLTVIKIKCFFYYCQLGKILEHCLKNLVKNTLAYFCSPLASEETKMFLINVH
jgi:hypothetical protein